MKEPLSDRTVYVFTSSGKHIRSVGTPEKPWFEKYRIWAFTLDSTGANLPGDTYWKYLVDIPPDFTFRYVIIDDLDGSGAQRGLAERGWHLVRVWMGSGVFNQWKVKVTEGVTAWWPEKETDLHRAHTEAIKKDALPDEDELSPEAEALLAKIKR